ncbi:glycosyltransferase [Roseiconus lacunae]|uniref:Glycosyltransferase n=1 Tax=Roseiconus lacunae TaxID=2605694 RepID=A0ABT7PQR4_9BACT|nr:glycosyltransferase [Roseiconus lacunae]MDM4018850.1 glycosyltransferase [Roseiconus lacunae]
MSSFRPSVSVIIPTYNCADYIGEAIDSVLNQSVVASEVIVIDDGSTDDTLDKLAKFRSAPGFQLLTQRNAGPHVARNRAIRVSSGSLIAFLDSDDIWYPNKLERQLKCFEGRQGLGVVYTARNWIDSNGHPIHEDLVAWKAVRGDCPVGELLSQNCVPMTTAMTHRETFDQVGWFDETLPCASDWDFWLRASCRCWFDCVDERLAAHRMHPGQITANRLSQVETTIKIQESFLANHPGIVNRRAIRSAQSNRLARRGKVRGKLGQSRLALIDLVTACCKNPGNSQALADLARLLLGRLKDPS